MRRMNLFISVCLMALFLLGSAGAQAQSYDKLWKQAEQAQEKSRPKTVIELADQIYRKALVEKNSGQLLKAYLCRENFKRQLTPDSLYSTLLYMERWADAATDVVEKAILHSLLAREYADYWRQNRRAVTERTDLIVDEPSVDIRTWTSRQFMEQVDRHNIASLTDVDRLMEIQASDYQPFIEQEEASAYYGHDLYHLLARRAIDAYQDMTGADADSLVQCRTDELYQEMIAAYGSRADGSDAVVLTTLDYWQWKAGDYLRQVRYYSLSARDLKTEKAYLDMLDGLMEKYADHPIVVEAYIRKAEWMSRGGEGQSIAEAIRLCDEGIRLYPKYNRIGELKRIRAGLLRPQISLSGEGASYPGDTLRLNVTYRTLDTPVTLNVYATNLKTYPTSQGCSSNADFRKCAPKRIYTAQHTFMPLPGEGKLEADIPYLPSDTLLSLPMPLVPGVYIVEAVPQAKNGQTERRFLSVSRLRVMTLDLGDGAIEITTLDNKNGHPVSGVTVDIYSNTDKLLKSVTTGTDGKALLIWQEKSYVARYVARKDDDTAMEPQRIYLKQTATPTPAISYEVS